MLDTLTRNWWVVALRGATAVFFGLLALIWPNITLLALVVLFGAYALVFGIVLIVLALRLRRLRADQAHAGSPRPATRLTVRSAQR